MSLRDRGRTRHRRRKGRRKGELGRTVGGEVGDASYSVALDLDVWGEHLTDERVESSESDDESFVLGCDRRKGREGEISSPLAPSPRPRIPADLSSWTGLEQRLTVDGKVSQGGACSPLHLVVVRTEKEEDGIEGVPADLSDLLLCDLGEGERC